MVCKISIQSVARPPNPLSPPPPTHIHTHTFHSRLIKSGEADLFHSFFFNPMPQESPRTPSPTSPPRPPASPAPPSRGPAPPPGTPWWAPRPTCSDREASAAPVTALGSSRCRQRQRLSLQPITTCRRTGGSALCTTSKSWTWVSCCWSGRWC